MLHYQVEPGNGLNSAFPTAGLPNIPGGWGPEALLILIGAGATSGLALRARTALEGAHGYRSTFESYIAQDGMLDGEFVSLNVGKERDARPFYNPAVRIAYYVQLAKVNGERRFQIRFPSVPGTTYQWPGGVELNAVHRHAVDYDLQARRLRYQVNADVVCDWAMDAEAIPSIGTLVLGSSGGSSGRNVTYLLNQIVETEV